MDTDDLRKSAKAVYLATDEVVAGEISKRLTWAADTIDSVTSEFWNTSQAPGRFRKWAIKKFFPEFCKLADRFREDVFWA